MRNIYFTQSGGWEVQDERVADLTSRDGILPGLQMATIFLYPHMAERKGALSLPLFMRE